MVFLGRNEIRPYAANELTGQPLKPFQRRRQTLRTWKTRSSRHSALVEECCALKVQQISNGKARAAQTPYARYRYCLRLRKYGQIDRQLYFPKRLLTYTRHDDDVFTKSFLHLSRHHPIEFVNLLGRSWYLSVYVVPGNSIRMSFHIAEGYTSSAPCVVAGPFELPKVVRQ